MICYKIPDKNIVSPDSQAFLAYLHPGPARLKTKESDVDRLIMIDLELSP